MNHKFEQTTNYRDRKVNSTSMSRIVTIPIWRVCPSSKLYVDSTELYVLIDLAKVFQMMF